MEMCLVISYFIDNRVLCIHLGRKSTGLKYIVKHSKCWYTCLWNRNFIMKENNKETAKILDLGIPYGC